MYKIFLFAPTDKKIIASIINAAAMAGAGTLGTYSHCAFVSKGYGTWVPLQGSDPTIGEIGKVSQVDEVKIEMECPKHKVEAVVRAIKKAHPYEKIAVDVVEFERFE